MRISQLALWALIVAAAAATCSVAGADPWDSDERRPRKPVDKKKEAPADVKPVPGLDHPREVFGPGSSPADTTDAIAENGAWTIVLVVYRGDQRDQFARLALNKVRVEGGLPNAYVEKRAESTVVAVGQFASGDSADAIAELKRVQEVVIGGQQPYEYALLAPPVNKPVEGQVPQFNLVRAKELFGDEALYTLQVAVYGRDDLDKATEADLAELRRAAEQAAVRLRQQGELAFYYHGPRRSMVTLGVFDQTDYDPQTPTYQSARLRDAKQRHPYNLYNGAGIKERKKGAPERLQPSTLVAVPKS